MPSTASDAATFDEVVAGPYCAAACEIEWAAPLEQMRQHLEAWAVHLMGIRLSDGTVDFSHAIGDSPPEANVDLMRRYHRIDPRAAMLMPLQPGVWANCHEHFDDAFVARDPFYQDFLIPYGGRYASASKVHQDDEQVVIFAIHRGMGMQPLNPAEVDLGRRYAAHLQTAVGLWRRHRKLLHGGAVGGALLDGLRQPVLLIDEAQHIHFQNAAARALIDREPRLHTNGNALRCTRAQDEAELRRALLKLNLNRRSARPGAGAREQRVVVGIGLRGEAGIPLLLMLSPVYPAETMGAFGSGSLAMVLVHDARKRQVIDPFIVAALYDFTPAEAGVAVAIANGDTVQQIATARGVAVSTIRAQLSNVLAKMGVSRQSQVAGALTSDSAFGQL